MELQNRKETACPTVNGLLSEGTLKLTKAVLRAVCGLKFMFRQCFVALSVPSLICWTPPAIESQLFFLHGLASACNADDVSSCNMLFPIQASKLEESASHPTSAFAFES